VQTKAVLVYHRRRIPARQPAQRQKAAVAIFPITKGMYTIGGKLETMAHRIALIDICLMLGSSYGFSR
jgi:hypothetical protein